MSSSRSHSITDIPQVLQPYIVGYQQDKTRDNNINSTVQTNRGNNAQKARVVTEKEYYLALEDYLTSAYATRPTRCNNDVSLVGVSHEKHELEAFHLQRMLCGGWLFDHQAHARYSYYPSNIYPLGSTDEYTCFMRAWSSNVNKDYVTRLYNRGGSFNRILKNVPPTTCPCVYLMRFNVMDEDIWEQYPKGDDGKNLATDKILTRVSVENELMFKSGFFNKNRNNTFFIKTNRWVYDTFVRPYHEKSSTDQQSAHLFKQGDIFQTASGRGVVITERWNRHYALAARVERQGTAVHFGTGSCEKSNTKALGEREECVEKAKYERCIDDGDQTHSLQRGSTRETVQGKTDNNSNNETDQSRQSDNTNVYQNEDVTNTDDAHDVYRRNRDRKCEAAFCAESVDNAVTGSTDRRSSMRGILSALYFGRMYLESAATTNIHDSLLTRCEHHESYLYSPRLKANACKHDHEEVSFVQRRCGDEIATELRKCKACGRVRVM